MSRLETDKLNTRVIRNEDFDAVVALDAEISGSARPEYYRRKFKRALDASDQLISSYVAEYEDRVVGFIMGDVFLGEFGIPDPTATIDTIGIDAKWQGSGVGTLLMDTFLSSARKSGVENVQTLVNWQDWDLLKFFADRGFNPTGTLHLELHLE